MFALSDAPEYSFLKVPYLQREEQIDLTNQNSKVFPIWILKTILKFYFRKRKRMSLFCAGPSTKREIGHFHVVVLKLRQRKQCTKESDARAKLLLKQLF